MKTSPNKLSQLANLLVIATLILAGATPAGRAATYLWDVATPGLNNWNVSGNWDPNGVPGVADTVIFGATGTSGGSTAVNNVVSGNPIITALSYTNTTSGQWHVTEVPAGVTLTVTNVKMGGLTGSGLVTDVALTDAGTLQVNGSLTIGNGGSSPNAISTVDLSGLSNFVCTASTGTISIGPANYGLANVTLAAVSNNLAAATLNDNISAVSSSSTTTFTLGSGTNIFNVGAFNMAYGRNSTTLSFPAGSVGGGLLIRGANGTDAGPLGNMTLGYHNTGGSGSHAAGTLSLNGYPVDIRLGTLTLGQSSSTPTGTSYGSGTVSFDTGTIYASNIVMAVSSGTTTYAQANGTINVGANGQLTVGAGGISLANQSAASGTATGNLNLNGGTVICSNGILKTTSAGTGNLTVNPGTLDLVAGTIGTATIPIDTLTLYSASLHLNVDGHATPANISANTLLASGNTITIDSVAGVTAPTTLHLISYNVATSGDEFYGFTLAPLPAGYTGSLVDNSVAGTIDLSISPAGVTVSSLLWVGAVGSTLNGSWDRGITANWLNTNGIPATYNDPDFVYFDDSASNAIVVLKTNLAPASFTFTNNTLNYTLNGTGSIGGNVGLFKAGGGSLTLAESGGDNFSGGIAVSAGTVVLDNANSAIAGGLAIAYGATAQIGNDDTNGTLPAGTVDDEGTLIFNRADDFPVASAIAGGGTLTQNGGGTLTLSGTNTYTGNTVVNRGTLALSGSGAISNSPTVSVNGATLDVSRAAGPAVLQYLNLANSALTVALTSLQPPVSVLNGLNMSGSGNTINVTALPAMASYPVTFALVASVGGISGYNLTLGSLPAGYAGNVAESGDTTTVLLTLTSGPVGVRPSVLWVGTNYVSATTNWSDALNWQLPGVPTPVDNVIFAGNGAVAATPFNVVGDGYDGLNNSDNINNFVDTGFTIGTLTYTNVGSSAFQNTLIASGATLNITNPGSLTVGSASADFGAGAKATATIAGMNGVLNVTNPNGSVFVGLGDAGSASELATLDLSGLGTFNATVSTFLVGVGSSAAGVSINRAGGVVYLAQTNLITASIATSGIESSDTSVPSIDIADAVGNGGQASFLYLGQTNAIYADAVCTGRQKSSGTMQFNPNLVSAATLPSAYFRGAGADAVAIWSMGDGVANGGTTTCTGVNDFSGGYVNALVGTLYAGCAANNTGGSGTATGTLTFDDGSFNVGALYAGYQPASGSKIGIGTINVNLNSTLGAKATLSVSGNLNLGLTTGGAGAAATAGTLSIGGGTVLANTIVTSTGGGASTVTLGANGYGGTLVITNTAGTLAAPLTTLNLDGGTLQINANATMTNIVATTVNAGGPTTLNIASVVNANSGTLQIPLLYYGGSDPFAGLTLGTVPAGYTGASLVDDTARQTIDLQITSPPTLTWVGAVGSTLNSNWDLNTPDWQIASTPVVYADPDFALFNDAASNSVVELATTLSPNNVTVNNSALNYTFIGGGKLNGPASLTKQGGGTLTIANSTANDFIGGITLSAGELIYDQPVNATVGGDLSGSGSLTKDNTNALTLAGLNAGYTGNVTIRQGTLVAGNTNALGSWSAGGITVTNGGTLDIGGFSTAIPLGNPNFGAKPVYLAGAGVNGNGAIVNNGTNAQLAAFENLTLTADATIGGASRWDLRNNNPILDLAGHTLTKTGANQDSLVAATVTAGDIIINQGTISVETTSAVNGTGTITVNSGGAFGHYRTSMGAITMPITLNGGALTNLSTSGGGSTNDSPITLTANSTVLLNSGSDLYLDGVISSAGSFGLTKLGPGRTVLTTNETYTGNTLINGGVLSLTGAGSISNSASISVASGASLDVSGSAGQFLVLNAGQTLSGFGTVTGSVTTATGSTLMAGSPSAPGILTVTGDATLGGTNAMKLDPVNLTNDVLAVGGRLTYGGTLFLASLNGTLAVSNSFQLFSASPGNYRGAFTGIVPSTPGAGLAWDTNALTTSGVLSITTGPSVNSNPTNITATVSGGVLTLSWPVDHTGWRLLAQTNPPGAGLDPSTNAWFPVSGSSAVNSESITVNPAPGTVFYRLVYP